MQPVEISGTIRAVARGGIAVGTSDNKMWKVAIVTATKIQVGTKVEVTGAATVDSLQSGFFVEFTAEVDNRGTIQEKVDALTVITPTREKLPGVYSDADGGFGGNVGGNGIDDSPKSGKKTGRTTGKSGRTSGKAASRAQMVGKCRIIGQLVVGRGGALSVRTGRTTLSFQLAEQPKIKVELADIRFAQVGQDVSVRGFASSRQPGMIQASEIKIKLPEVPAADKAEKRLKKESAAKSDAKKSAKRSKKDKEKDKEEGLPEPADAP
jgi:hypothetical protein